MTGFTAAFLLGCGGGEPDPEALRSGGYAIPSPLEAGRRLGTEGKFRFFRAVLEEAIFR